MSRVYIFQPDSKASARDSNQGKSEYPLLFPESEERFLSANEEFQKEERIFGPPTFILYFFFFNDTLVA